MTEIRNLDSKFETKFGNLESSVKALESTVQNLDMKFNAAGYGAIFSLGIFVAGGNIVEILEYFDKKAKDNV